jgi:hypothetical protein
MVSTKSAAVDDNGILPVGVLPVGVHGVEMSFFVLEAAGATAIVVLPSLVGLSFVVKKVILVVGDIM